MLLFLVPGDLLLFFWCLTPIYLLCLTLLIYLFPDSIHLNSYSDYSVVAFDLIIFHSSVQGSLQSLRFPPSTTIRYRVN